MDGCEREVATSEMSERKEKFGGIFVPQWQARLGSVLMLPAVSSSRLSQSRFGSAVCRDLRRAYR